MTHNKEIKEEIEDDEEEYEFITPEEVKIYKTLFKKDEVELILMMENDRREQKQNDKEQEEYINRKYGGTKPDKF
jgi:DNA-binding MltR family transcriptional regulator